MKIMREYENWVNTAKENITPLTGPLYEGKKEPEAKILKAQYFREIPLRVTFEQLIQYHDLIPQIRLPVSAYRELITGTDMVFNSENEEATDFLNEWVRQSNFYDKFENMVTTLLICGNSILERLSEDDTEDVQEVDMSTIIGKKRTDIGELEYYDQRVKQGVTVKLGEGNLDRFIEFNLTHYSNQAWGRSLFYPLAVPRTTGERVTPPLCEIMIATEDAIGAILINNAYPITTITYPGANDKYLEKETEKWRRYRPGDKRVQKIKPEIEFFEAQNNMGRLESLLSHMEKTFMIGTQFPTDIMTGDFTSRASSETTDTMTMKLVRGFQHYLCNKLKAKLFEPILEQNGFDTSKLKLEIAFTTLNIIELDVDQVKGLVGQGLMTNNEGRMWLRDNTGMELPDDDLIDQEKEEQKEQDEQQLQMKDKVKGLESKLTQLSFDKTTDTKLKEMKDMMDRKMDMVKDAMNNDNKLLFKRREKVLETLIKKAEKLG